MFFVNIFVVTGFLDCMDSCALKYMHSPLSFPFLSDGCMHLPQVQYTMPTSQYKEESVHCIVEEI